MKIVSMVSAPYPFEEMANSITHGMGALLSLAGLSVLVVLASRSGLAPHIAGCAIFGTTLVLLYTASTLYHTFNRPKLKHIFKIIDHSCIYLLIAGTYTPFMLVTLSGIMGWTLLTVIWTLTVIGIAFKVIFVYRFRIVSTIGYLMMGWLAVAAMKPLAMQLPPAGMIWIVVGGLSYSAGTIFYLWKRLPYIIMPSGTFSFWAAVFVII